MTGSYKQRVELGAAWLDENEPTWVYLIDLAELRLESEFKCVLAQVFGSYSAGNDKLEAQELESAEMGFDVYMDEDMDKAYYWLQRRWIEQINQRRQAA